MKEKREAEEKELKQKKAEEKKQKRRRERGLVGSRSLFSKAGGAGFYSDGEMN